MAGWTVDDVAYELERKREEDGILCALLIGAGCSYQAGIPLARGFVEQIEKRFLREYARGTEQHHIAAGRRRRRSGVAGDDERRL